MAAPSLPSVGAWFGSDGFRDRDRPLLWNNVPSPGTEHTDFDLAVRPPELNPALLTSEMVKACITVEDVPFTTWGITQTEPTFIRNKYDPSQAFNVGASKNSNEFWVLYALSAYESNEGEDYDPNTEGAVLGASDDFVRVFCEAIRDVCANTSGSQPYDVVLQRNITHEILHCFLGGHVFTTGTNLQDMTSITNQGILKQGADITEPAALYILNKDQIKAIQKNANPKPL
jgi:hypothetical protein